MSVWISLLNDGAVSIFGSILSASFCGILNEKRNRRIFWIGMIVVLLIQVGIYSVWDAEFLRKIYPILVHLPLMILLYLMTKKVLWSVISVFTAYLCCQLRRWLALLIVEMLSGGEMMQDVAEVSITLPLVWLLLRYVAPIVRELSYYPKKLQCMFGVIPALYYVFDYVTMVYTRLLTSGSPVVVEFMPFVCCAAYLVFLAYNSAEQEKRIQLQQAQNALDIQLKQSVQEIGRLRESQAMARQYRHDLRHHLQYVAACMENGQEEEGKKYISEICHEIETQKVQNYCENEAANLILSSFVARAKKEGIDMEICGVLPSFLLIPDTDLCIILSNTLENAINACRSIAKNGERCVIDVQFHEKDGNLFLQVTNPYQNEVRFENGIPVSDRAGHGIGVQSICAIVERHHGMCSFQAKDGEFTVRLFL